MPAPLTELVAEQVRAEMARRRISGTQLGAKIGKPPRYISRRLTGVVAFDTEDLAAISEALGVDVRDLMRAPERAA
ncbi:MAG TPA: helix-turn-helix transcriptional regulator [Solirubrobacterales bacterium]